MCKASITVLMPVFNAEKYLNDAIESVLNQTFKDFEFTRIYFGGTGRSIDLIIYGILIILICIFRPAGIISLFPKDLRERKKN